MKKIFLILIILSLSKDLEAINLRIGLLNGETAVNISSTGYLELIDLATDEILLTTYGWKNGFIKLNQSRLEVKDVGIITGSIRVRPIVGANILVNGNKYRGEIEIGTGRDGIKVINVVDLEEYLYGVIKPEMTDKAPIEALKAQAIIARTFAIDNLKKHEEEGYNLCSKIHCQVYKGMDVESEKTINAVDSTQGQILTFEGDVASTFYHAWCGGITASAQSVWGQDIPYLQEVYDPFCRKSNKGWDVTFSLSEIKDILNRNGFNISNISSISASSNTNGGRVKEVIIKNGNGELTISSSKFRLIMGSDKIWSTIFTIRTNGDKVTFQGIGKGHGVGLCQQGAVSMAELGYNYKQILGFYYPGVFLSSIISEGE
ncbi:MAG: SpoIID/LytB domain-containing protein [bacterium]